MQIERKGPGPWPEMEQEGSVVEIFVNGQSKSYDCAQLQKDWTVEIDIVQDASGQLCEGVANGVAYVANLIIPPGKYEQVENPDAGIMTLAEGEEETPGMMRMDLVETVSVPLGGADMESVRLILWTIQPASDNDADAGPAYADVAATAAETNTQEEM